MRSMALAVTVAMFATGGSAQAQDYGRACLLSASSSDATVFCLKASVLLQRAQLQRLDDVLAALNRLSDRTIAAIDLSGARTSQALGPLGDIARSGGYLFVDDLTNIEGSVFECATGDCAADAQTAAAKICQELKFAGSHSFDFKESEPGSAWMRMHWLVCRR